MLSLGCTDKDSFFPFWILYEFSFNTVSLPVLYWVNYTVSIQHVILSLQNVLCTFVQCCPRRRRHVPILAVGPVYGRGLGPGPFSRPAWPHTVNPAAGTEDGRARQNAVAPWWADTRRKDWHQNGCAYTSILTANTYTNTYTQKCRAEGLCPDPTLELRCGLISII